MTFWPCMIIAMAYFVIGAFIGGLFGDGDDPICWIFLWPLLLVGMGILLMVSLPIAFGHKIRKYFKNKKEK